MPKGLKHTFKLGFSDIVAIILAAMSFLISFNFIMNHFYVSGAYMLDSGWFSYLYSRSTSLAMLNPPAIGGSYLHAHISPFFFLTSLLYEGITASGFPLSQPLWFGLWQGLWHAIIFGSVYLLVRGQNSESSGVAAAVCALSVAFSGLMLSFIGFPHFEIGIPALILLFFWSHLAGRSKLAFLVFCLALTLREDVGFHFTAFLSVFAFFNWRGNHKIEMNVLIYYIVIAFLYTIIVIFYQKYALNPNGGSFSRIYSGDPAYQHLNFDFIFKRTVSYVRDRLYIVVPLSGIVIFSILLRSPIMFGGFLAVAPWSLISFLAVTPLAGTLGAYYGFPILVAYAWPAIVVATYKSNQRHYVYYFILLWILTFAGFIFSRDQHDAKPWNSFGFHWVKTIPDYKILSTKINDIFKQPDVVFDGAITSLFVDNIDHMNWSYLANFTEDRAKNIKFIYYKDKSWDNQFIFELQKKRGLLEVCEIAPGYKVAYGVSPPRDCRILRNDLGSVVAGQNAVWDRMSGWSHAEPTGRWSLGARSVIPAFAVGSSSVRLCLSGHAFLPLPTSRVTVMLTIEGAPEPVAVFTPGAAVGEYCASITGVNGQTPIINMEVTGASSPLASGVSTDPRILGFFLRSVTLR